MCVFNLISQQFVVVVLVSTKTFILNQKEADTHIKNKSFNGKSATVGHNIFSLMPEQNDQVLVCSTDFMFISY